MNTLLPKIMYWMDKLNTIQTWVIWPHTNIRMLVYALQSTWFATCSCVNIKLCLKSYQKVYKYQFLHSHISHSNLRLWYAKLDKHTLLRFSFVSNFIAILVIFIQPILFPMPSSVIFISYENKHCQSTLTGQ